LGLNSDALEPGGATAGAIESKLVTVPERSALVIARWNRRIEGALAPKESAAAGAALKVPIRQGIRPFEVPAWAGARESAGAVLIFPGPAGFLSCRSRVAGSLF
jgi:hypothetical protein